MEQHLHLVQLAVGQGFADEIFRVFQNKYPEIQLEVTNANETVLGMIQHVKQ